MPPATYHNSLLALLPAIGELGAFGYWLAALVAFLESLAFIGTLVPGAILTIIFGALAAQHAFHVTTLIWFVTAGAFLGDQASFYLGRNGSRFFSPSNKLLKESHLDLGKKYFEKYGLLSIVLGRFVGLVRSIVPFVAGLSGMRLRVFIIIDLISAFAWALVHVLIGFYFSNVLAQLFFWSHRAGRLVFSVAAVVILCSALWYQRARLMRIARLLLHARRARKESVVLPLDPASVAPEDGSVERPPSA